CFQERSLVDHIVLLGTPDFVLLGTQSTCKALERKAFRNRNARARFNIYLSFNANQARTGHITNVR
ncbi:TPA: hypothetical protein ACSBZ3_003983, partial [Acinetobacter baumannii]